MAAELNASVIGPMFTSEIRCQIALDFELISLVGKS